MIPRSARGRDLERPELARLVRRIAARPALWRPHVRHQLDRRVYEQLWRDQHVDVWLICWWHDHDTGYHDHDVSSGAVHVLSGELVEDRLRLGSEPAQRHCGPGATFDFDASHVHRMRHVGDAPAVSLHAYSPALWRMGAYSVGPDGSLTRTSVSYAEELRAEVDDIAAAG